MASITAYNQGIIVLLKHDQVPPPTEEILITDAGEDRVTDTGEERVVVVN